MVGMCHESLFRELLQQPAEGIAIGAHAPLFDDYVALLIEFPHYGMQEALGLKIGPEFQAILGKRVVVRGLVVVGEGIHVFTAILLDDFSELIGDDVLVRAGNRILPGFL